MSDSNLDLAVVTRNLSDISFKIGEMNVRLEDIEMEVKGVSATILKETHESWKKVIDRKDLKIICETSKEQSVSMERLQSQVSVVSSALNSYNESFVKNSEEVMKQIKELNKNVLLNKEFISDSSNTFDEPENKIASTNEAGFRATLFISILIASFLSSALTSIIIYLMMKN